VEFWEGRVKFLGAKADVCGTGFLVRSLGENLGGDLDSSSWWDSCLAKSFAMGPSVFGDLEVESWVNDLTPLVVRLLVFSFLLGRSLLPLLLP
jgi:hypothetical protein